MQRRVTTGICGSGLLDIIAGLVTTGIITVNGKFISAGSVEILTALKERLVQRDGKTVFMITENVWLTQKDIRQVQFAKEPSMPASFFCSMRRKRRPHQLPRY